MRKGRQADRQTASQEGRQTDGQTDRLIHIYRFNLYIYIYIEDTYTQCIYFFYWKQCSHLISSHLISSHSILSYPIQSHPISSHHLISFHLISSHLISSHLSLSLSIASTMFLHIHLCWCEPAKYPSINPSMHRSICLSSWSIQKKKTVPYHPCIGPSVPCFKTDPKNAAGRPGQCSFS